MCEIHESKIVLVSVVGFSCHKLLQHSRELGCDTLPHFVGITLGINKLKVTRILVPSSCTNISKVSVQDLQLLINSWECRQILIYARSRTTGIRTQEQPDGNFECVRPIWSLTTHWWLVTTWNSVWIRFKNLISPFILIVHVNRVWHQLHWVLKEAL